MLPLLQLHGRSVRRALAAVLQREGLRSVYGSVKAAAARAGRVLPSVPVMPVSSFCLQEPDNLVYTAEQQHTSAGASVFSYMPQPHCTVLRALSRE